MSESNYRARVKQVNILAPKNPAKHYLSQLSSSNEIYKQSQINNSMIFSFQFEQNR